MTGETESFPDESSMYERLGLQYIPPELRRGTDEIDRARQSSIPQLVEVSDLKGDLHVHTEWSDGRDPTELMAVAAHERGYEYVAITDHSAGRGIANGLSVERLKEHIHEIRQLEDRLGNIKLMGRFRGRHPRPTEVSTTPTTRSPNSTGSSPLSTPRWAKTPRP